MRIKTLKIEQFRGFANSVEIPFHDRFTLIAGENGVGKSSVLWALRVLLSHIIHLVPKRSAHKLHFQVKDVAAGWPYLRAEATVGTTPRRAISTCSAQKYASEFTHQLSDDGRPRDVPFYTPDSYKLKMEADGPLHMRKPVEPVRLAVYYSAHRSVARDIGISKGRSMGGEIAAHADALKDRELYLGEQSALWHKEQELEKSDKRPAKANRAIERTVRTFLGDFENLRTEVEDGDPTLYVDKSGKRLDLSQLSDGERGLLTLLLDLSRRLSQANPDLEHPARDGHAVVLIDELDLHLHPKWQRTVVKNLMDAFPKVQFIATTHSPQILGEVPSHQIVLLQKDGPVVIPSQAFGMDSNWILRHIMDSDTRNPVIAAKLEEIMTAIREAKLTKASKLVAELRAITGESPDLAAAQAKIDRAELIVSSAKEMKPTPKKRREP